MNGVRPSILRFSIAVRSEFCEWGMRQPENRRIEGLTPTLYSPVESFGSAAEIGMLDHDSREVFHDAIKNHIDGYRRLLPRPLL